MTTDWILALPSELSNDVATLAQNPETLRVLHRLYEHFTGNKKRKVAEPNETPVALEEGVLNSITGYSKPGMVQLNNALIKEDAIIFEINQVSFQSPIRKKMNLSFHLVEKHGVPVPIFSIVNPVNQIAEISVIELSQVIKLCCLVPIVNNSVTYQKKNVVMMCIWLHDEYVVNDSKDPIICQLNLDLIRKQLVKLGKIPSDIETQLAVSKDTKDMTLSALLFCIVDYFQRQFKLCGINLLNYLPCGPLNNFTLNNDDAISIANNDTNIFIMVECHKGAKDGVLIFLTTPQETFIIFGFKKPILIFSVKSVNSTSYSNITSKTFNINFSVVNEKNEEKDIEFSIIDHKYFDMIDVFLKSQNLNDNSFDENLREKETTAPTNGTAELVQAVAADEDSEEDEDYKSGAEVEGSEVDESDTDGGDDGSDGDAEEGEGEEGEGEEGDVDLEEDLQVDGNGTFFKSTEVEEIEVD